MFYLGNVFAESSATTKDGTLANVEDSGDEDGDEGDEDEDDSEEEEEEEEEGSEEEEEDGADRDNNSDEMFELEED